MRNGVCTMKLCQMEQERKLEMDTQCEMVIIQEMDMVGMDLNIVRKCGR